MGIKNWTSVVAVALGLGGLSLSSDREGGVEPGDFARTTIDLGLVVSDIEKSAAFYGDVLGFEELEGFTAPAEITTGAGLCDGMELKIRVFALGTDETATKLKLMQVPGVESKEADNTFIHSQLGFSYLTVYVNDSDAALERCAKAGVKPLADAPVLIGEEGKGPFLSVVRDPDGNMVELIGPVERRASAPRPR